MKCQSIAYLLNESEHIYWILDLEGEVHSIWADKWLLKVQGQWFFQSRTCINFRSGPKNLDFLDGRLTLLESTSPKKFVWGEIKCPMFEPSVLENQFSNTMSNEHPIILFPLTNGLIRRSNGRLKIHQVFFACFIPSQVTKCLHHIWILLSLPPFHHTISAIVGMRLPHKYLMLLININPIMSSQHSIIKIHKNDMNIF